MMDLDAIFGEPLPPAPVVRAIHLDEAHLDDEADQQPDTITRGMAWIASQRWTEQTSGGRRIIMPAGATAEPLRNFPADGWPPGELRPLLWRANEEIQSHRIHAHAMQAGTSTADTCARGERQRGT